MNDSKRQVLPRGLWVVATPIGNLSDLSLRARAALEQADTILCEDTRVTARLISAIGLVTAAKLLRMDAHAEPAAIAHWVRRLAEGDRVALVSDAGTPALSDPGAALVREARAAGVTITPVPGSSAVATLVSVAGFVETAFTFHGYFPRSAGDRVALLECAARSETARVAIWFESPQRIVSALGEVARVAPAAEVVAAKELTKIHERFFAGTAPEVATAVTQEVEREGALGEWLFAVRFPEATPVESSEWVKALACLLDAGVSASEAAKRVSQHFGVAKNSAYQKSLSLSPGRNDKRS